ncbi:MAG: phosphodiester glycosidase family protein [Halanaerobiales bacterium]|nr:phosphodiester glycosidase family protein [Halanaerobiales bacterium]
MQNLKFLNTKIINKTIYIFLILIFLIIFSQTAGAEYFEAGLKDYIINDHLIRVPVFNPVESIEIRSKYNAVLSSAGNEDLKLETGENYFIVLNSAAFNRAAADSSEERQETTREEKADGEMQTDNTVSESIDTSSAVESPRKEMRYVLQIFAGSTEENAESRLAELEEKIDAELNIIEEGGLFKLLAGNFKNRAEAEAFEAELKEIGIEGWIKEVMLSIGGEVEQDLEAAQAEDNNTDSFVDTNQVSDNIDSAEEIDNLLALYNSQGEKIRTAESFRINGYFEAKGNELSGDFKFNSFNNKVRIEALTNLDRLTSALLKNYFETDTPREALKAQAVIYRTGLLYQLQSYGSELVYRGDYNFGLLEPAYKNAVNETENQVLVRDDSFYYNSDFELRELKKPRTGIIPLAQADYSCQEILDYYYQRSETADLKELMDSEVKFTAGITYGLKFQEIRQFNWNGPRLITVIDYNLNVERLRLKPVLAGDQVPGREDLEDLIKRHSALAGVNGGYFHYTGRPLGLLYLDGELVSEPLYNRTSLLIAKDGSLDFEQVKWEGQVIINSGEEKIMLDGVNRNTGVGEAILFNSYYGKNVPELKNRYYDIVVRSGEILGVEDDKGSQSAIPPDGYVIRVEKSKENILALIPQLAGKSAQLDLKFSPDFEALNIIHAVGGGPGLLKDGEVNITGEEERFQSDILKNRSPRTALGLTADQHLIMLTVDGRQQEISVGMSLEELALTLKDLGAEDAMNLDGGGSARMVIRGFTMNSPSEKRYISNGILINDN